MIKNKENLDKIIKKIKEEDDNIPLKKWNEELFSKFILLFPTLIFLLTFLSINNDKSISDLMSFLLVSILLVLVGVILNFLLTKK